MFLKIDALLLLLISIGCAHQPAPPPAEENGPVRAYVVSLDLDKIAALGLSPSDVEPAVKHAISTYLAPFTRQSVRHSPVIVGDKTYPLEALTVITFDPVLPPSRQPEPALVRIDVRDLLDGYMDTSNHDLIDDR